MGLHDALVSTRHKSGMQRGGKEGMTARQRVLCGQRLNWRIGNLIAFAHGPNRRNIYRLRVDELRDGKPYRAHLVVKNAGAKR